MRIELLRWTPLSNRVGFLEAPSALTTYVSVTSALWTDSGQNQPSGSNPRFWLAFKQCKGGAGQSRRLSGVSLYMGAGTWSPPPSSQTVLCAGCRSALCCLYGFLDAFPGGRVRRPARLGGM